MPSVTFCAVVLSPVPQSKGLVNYVSLKQCLAVYYTVTVQETFAAVDKVNSRWEGSGLVKAREEDLNPATHNIVMKD